MEEGVVGEQKVCPESSRQGGGVQGCSWKEYPIGWHEGGRWAHAPNLGLRGAEM